MAAYTLVVPVTVLVSGALAVSVPAGTDGLLNPGPHGLSEAMYAVTSASNNNGSAFAGLTSGTPFWNTLLGICMLLGRFLGIVLVLALAGDSPPSTGSPPALGRCPPTDRSSSACWSAWRWSWSA